ncbi:MAG: GspE/PulE family protein [Planctomycetaceae bacterium]
MTTLPILQPAGFSADGVVKPRGLTTDQLQRLRELIHLDDWTEQFAFEMELENREQALEVVAAEFGMSVVDLSQVQIDPQLLDGFPIRLIHRHSVFPTARDDQTLALAIRNPFDLQALDAVSSATGVIVAPQLALASELSQLIKTHLGVGAQTVDGLIAQDEPDDDVQVLEDLVFDDSEASDMAQQASVVRLVNEILSEAVQARASDIHLEAQANGMKIRYRIDGVLQTQPVPAELDRFRLAIVSRLKIMSRMNIAEKRLPQDGRIKLRISGREVDIRVSVIPMHHGEGVVMRVLDKDAMSFSLQSMGLESDTLDTFQRLIRQPHGIVLVTGPTGSGKTTTLYSALAAIKSDKTKIITTEDPIEYQLDGINQIQVHAKVGLTFATSLRSILRHDPDVVLVGEIRDAETAENAIQAALTGHMVFSTLHTNDASSAFMRLTDMGVEPFLVASTVESIMAQRLVRTLCPECRTATVPNRDELPDDFPTQQSTSTQPVYQPRGCRSCRGTGYRGRLGIYELLEVDDEVRSLANERRTSAVIKHAAVARGMRTLRQDGWNKVLQGKTSVDEVLRVTKTD